LGDPDIAFLFLDVLLYGLMLLVIILSARNLLLLAQFHHFDEESLKRLKYVDSNGKILLCFK